MQQRDQSDLRRNNMDKLVRDILQAFTSGVGISSTTNQTAAVRTYHNLTSTTTGVYSLWKDTICYIRVLEHVQAGNGNVAAASESRAGWLV